MTKTELVRSPSGNRTLSGVVTTSDAGIKVALTSSDQCRVYQQQTVQRVRVEERRLRRSDYYTLLGVGIVGVLAGSVISIDARNVPASADRLEDNPVGRTGAYVIGVGLLGIGIGAGAAGILQNRRVTRTEEAAGEESITVPGSERSEACDARPVRAKMVVVTVSGAGGAERTFSLGRTGPAGQLAAPWRSVPTGILVGDKWERSAAVVTVDGATKIGVVDLSLARARLAAAEWARIPADAPWPKYVAFHRRFSDHRTAEVKAAFRRLRLKVIKREIAVALMAKRPNDAKAQLTEWRTFDPDSSRLAEVTKLYAKARVKYAAMARWIDLDAAIQSARRGDLSAAAKGAALVGELEAQVGARDRRLTRERRKLSRATYWAVRKAALRSMQAARAGKLDEAQRILDAAKKLRSKDNNVARAARVLRLQRKRDARRIAKLPMALQTPVVSLRSAPGNRHSLSVAMTARAKRRLVKARITTEATCKVETWEFRSASARAMPQVAAGLDLPLRAVLFEKPSLHASPTWCELSVGVSADALRASSLGRYCWRDGKVRAGTCR